MLEVRNSDNRLVCKINEQTGAVQICIKDCITLIERDSNNGEIKITNTRK